MTPRHRGRGNRGQGSIGGTDVVILGKLGRYIAYLYAIIHLLRFIAPIALAFPLTKLADPYQPENDQTFTEFCETSKNTWKPRKNRRLQRFFPRTTTTIIPQTIQILG